MTAAPNDILKSIAERAQALDPWINEKRQHLHRNPELSFAEEKTAAFVRAELEKLGYSPAAAIPGRHGFHVDLVAPANPDKFVLLRADMDALPIQEENNVPFKSQNPGVGHLCGHDVHTSMLLGAAGILKDLRDKLPVSVRFVFQHAEEVEPGGAQDFVKAGLTDDVLGCFGIHVSPRVESGYFGVRAGEAMACVGTIKAVIRGRGGHGAAPHETIDPVPAAAACILNLQNIVARRIPPQEPAVVSVTMIHAGTASNVIPNEVSFGGTFRSFNMDRIPEMERMIEEIVRDTAKAYGCVAEVSAIHSYPPVVNDEQAIEAARQALTGLFGETVCRPIEKSMGAEDFAYFGIAKPSAFLFLGVLPNGETFYPLHHPNFLPDDKVFWKGSALLASMPFVAPQYLSTTR
ncbi:amidohydrolase [bacterium]|nr:amidohydrolase [bacterium]